MSQLKVLSLVSAALLFCISFCIAEDNGDNSNIIDMKFGNNVVFGDLTTTVNQALSIHLNIKDGYEGGTWCYTHNGGAVQNGKPNFIHNAKGGVYAIFLSDATHQQHPNEKFNDSRVVILECDCLIEKEPKLNFDQNPPKVTQQSVIYKWNITQEPGLYRPQGEYDNCDEAEPHQLRTFKIPRVKKFHIEVFAKPKFPLGVADWWSPRDVNPAAKPRKLEYFYLNPCTNDLKVSVTTLDDYLLAWVEGRKKPDPPDDNGGGWAGGGPQIPDDPDGGPGPHPDDCDELNHEQEAIHGTDPEHPDTDRDGITDGWEVSNGLDPLNFDGSLDDIDEDSLSNLYEYEFDADLAREDGEITSYIDYGDSLPDSWELINGTSPSDFDDGKPHHHRSQITNAKMYEVEKLEYIDADSDGLNDYIEEELGLNTSLQDTDGDGFSDFDEVNNFYRDPLVVESEDFDGDKDSLTDLEELALGTHPANADTDGDSLPDGFEQTYGLNLKSFEHEKLITHHPFYPHLSSELFIRDATKNNYDAVIGPNVRVSRTSLDIRGGCNKGSYVTFPKLASKLDELNHYTMFIKFFLFEVNEHNADRVIFAKKGNLRIVITPENQLRVMTKNYEDPGFTLTTFPAEIPNRVWQSLSIYVDGSSAIFSVDGVELGSITLDETTPHLFGDSPWPLLLGYPRTPTGLAPNASYLHFRVYEGAIAPETLSLLIDHTDPNHENNQDIDADGLNFYQELALKTIPDQPDSDGDGLTDGEEFALETDPWSLDSDGDGVSDGDEVNLHDTDPTDRDSDNDGATDGQEIVLYQTDPKDADMDNDGLLDGQELSYGLNPNSASDANQDLDGDGLTNAEEIAQGKDPRVPETRFEEPEDEVTWEELDELANEVNQDSDGDGLTDREELSLPGFDPDSEFSFANTEIDDATRARYGLYPPEEGGDFTPYSDDGDFDGDGVSNLEEVLQGVDPTSAGLTNATFWKNPRSLNISTRSATADNEYKEFDNVGVTVNAPPNGKFLLFTDTSRMFGPQASAKLTLEGVSRVAGGSELVVSDHAIITSKEEAARLLNHSLNDVIEEVGSIDISNWANGLEKNEDGSITINASAEQLLLANEQLADLRRDLSRIDDENNNFTFGSLGGSKNYGNGWNATCTYCEAPPRVRPVGEIRDLLKELFTIEPPQDDEEVSMYARTSALIRVFGCDLDVAAAGEDEVVPEEFEDIEGARVTHLYNGQADGLAATLVLRMTGDEESVRVLTWNSDELLIYEDNSLVSGNELRFSEDREEVKLLVFVRGDQIEGSTYTINMVNEGGEYTDGMSDSVTLYYTTYSLTVYPKEFVGVAADDHLFHKASRSKEIEGRQSQIANISIMLEKEMTVEDQRFMLPALPGSEVVVEAIQGELEDQIVSLNLGEGTARFELGDVKGDKFSFRAYPKKIIDTEGNEDNYTASANSIYIYSGDFEMTHGHPVGEELMEQFSMLQSGFLFEFEDHEGNEVNSVVQDGDSIITVTATMKDIAGNELNEGLPVLWHYDGSGTFIEGDKFTREGGLVQMKVKSPDLKDCGPDPFHNIILKCVGQTASTNLLAEDLQGSIRFREADVAHSDSVDLSELVSFQDPWTEVDGSHEDNDPLFELDITKPEEILLIEAEFWVDEESISPGARVYWEVANCQLMQADSRLKLAINRKSGVAQLKIRARYTDLGAPIIVKVRCGNKTMELRGTVKDLDSNVVLVRRAPDEPRMISGSETTDVTESFETDEEEDISASSSYRCRFIVDAPAELAGTLVRPTITSSILMHGNYHVYGFIDLVSDRDDGLVLLELDGDRARGVFHAVSRGVMDLESFNIGHNGISAEFISADLTNEYEIIPSFIIVGSGKFLRSIKSFVKGFLIGTQYSDDIDFEQIAGDFTSGLFVVGDVRDLIGEGVNWVVPNRCANRGVALMSVMGILATGNVLDVALTGLKVAAKVYKRLGISVEPLYKISRRMLSVYNKYGGSAEKVIDYAEPWIMIYGGILSFQDE